MDFEEDLKVIAVYEDSIDRAESDRIVVQDENGVLSPAGPLALIPDFEKVVHWYAEKCEDFLRYGFEMNACLDGRMPRYSQLTLRYDTPELYLHLGFKDLPFDQTQRHLKNEVSRVSVDEGHCHGLSLPLARAIPELLERPVAVIEDWHGRGAIAVLPALDARRRPIIVPIAPSGVGTKDDTPRRANVVLSVYGKDRFERFLENAATHNEILYINKRRMKGLLRCAGLQLPRACKSLDGIIQQSPSALRANSLMRSRNPRVCHNGQRAGQEGKSADLRSRSEVERKGAWCSLPAREGDSLASRVSAAKEAASRRAQEGRPSPGRESLRRAREGAR